MDFPERLNRIFVKEEHNEETATIVSALDGWNAEIETFLSEPPTTAVLSEEVDETALASLLQAVAFKLHRDLLRSSSSKLSAKISSKSGDYDLEKLAILTQQADDDFVKEHEPPDENKLFVCIRAAKNLLRWYIQIFLEMLVVRSTVTMDASKRHPVQVLQSPATLSLVFHVLQYCVQQKKDSENTRYASLHLFYATYNPVPSDAVAQEGMGCLINQLAFPMEALAILCKTDSVTLALALIRNLHNLAVSFQGAAKIILDTEIECWSEDTTAPWLAQSTSSDKKKESFVSVCTCLASWCVVDAKPDFPGEDSDDKRSELVVEILNCFYALRIGQQLKVPSVESSDNNDLATFVSRILKLSSESKSASTDKRIKQCKLAIVSLLMDSDVSFGRYLLDNQSLPFLLQILSQQVNDVVDNTRVDCSATAALVPVLVVLNKYAVGSSEVKKQIKEFVFPPASEADFLNNVGALQTSKSNMGPLDAPKGTLRGKLVLLLSWAESYIKRCTAEFLWTLCNSDATEYVHRVGMGNALPLLNAKGLASLPSQS